MRTDALPSAINAYSRSTYRPEGADSGRVLPVHVRVQHVPSPSTICLSCERYLGRYPLPPPTAERARKKAGCRYSGPNVQAAVGTG